MSGARVSFRRNELTADRMVVTKRLQIVPFSDRHLTERYVNWLNDPEVTRYSDQRHKRHTLESCASYWRSFEGTSNGFWAIEALDPELGHIGNVTTYVDTTHSVADMGILIGERRVWGRGYGSEAWIAMCRYLLETVGVRKVTAGTLAVNLRMLGIMRNAGMVDDGRRIRQCTWEGEEVDLIHAALWGTGAR